MLSRPYFKLPKMKMTESRALILLNIMFFNRSDIVEHSLMVSNKAIKIGNALKRKGYKINLELLRLGALLHDIGRAKTNSVKHGFEGGKILRELGCPKLARIAECHVGAGIPKDEARELGLPEKDFLPQTLEEKIVAYADKFFGTRLVFNSYIIEDVKRKVVEFKTIDNTKKQFINELGKDHPAIRRLNRLETEIETKLN